MSLQDFPGDDASYGGEVSASPLSLDYYRAKAREFQATMVALDQTASAIRDIIGYVDDDSAAGLQQSLDEYDSRKGQFRAAVEAVNLGANVINSMGGRFPVLSIPQGLAAVPLLIPAAAVAGFTVAAGLILWGRDWIAGVNERAKLAMIADPAKRDLVIAKAAEIDAAAKAANDSPLASLAGIAKWAGIAALVYMGWRMLQNAPARD